jgi:hypothetical protein
MPGDLISPGVVSEKIEGIPLFLIPKIVADQIRKRGDTVFQILVERKFHHRYTVIVETLTEHTQRVNQEDPVRPEGDGHG